MIRIQELARAVHARGYLMIFEFHCDLSYDGSPEGNVKGKTHEPNTYVFGGFFSSVSTWGNVEKKWTAINADYKVSRFHAAHLNSKTHEYKGWDDPKKVAYSKELIGAVHDEGNRMYGVTCGLFADEYRKIISEKGRRKIGSPYLACFNSCVTRVARMMDESGPGNILPEDKFAVLIDPDDGYLEAVESFYRMKENPTFLHRARLATCAPLKMEECVAMQPADLIAYETFKRLHAQRKRKGEIRYVLKALMKENIVNESYIGAATLRRMKDQIESTPSGNGQLIIFPTN
jgi:hypothetical protein